MATRSASQGPPTRRSTPRAPSWSLRTCSDVPGRGGHRGPAGQHIARRRAQGGVTAAATLSSSLLPGVPPRRRRAPRIPTEHALPASTALPSGRGSRSGRATSSTVEPLRRRCSTWRSSAPSSTRSSPADHAVRTVRRQPWTQSGAESWACHRACHGPRQPRQTTSLHGSQWREHVRRSGSGGRTRTYDQAVNSRPLYH
jgi:hypothetical protein